MLEANANVAVEPVDMQDDVTNNLFGKIEVKKGDAVHGRLIM